MLTHTTLVARGFVVAAALIASGLAATSPAKTLEEATFTPRSGGTPAAIAGRQSATSIPPAGIPACLIENARRHLALGMLAERRAALAGVLAPRPSPIAKPPTTASAQMPERMKAMPRHESAEATASPLIGLSRLRCPVPATKTVMAPRATADA